LHSQAGGDAHLDGNDGDIERAFKTIGKQVDVSAAYDYGRDVHTNTRRQDHGHINGIERPFDLEAVYGNGYIPQGPPNSETLFKIEDTNDNGTIENDTVGEGGAWNESVDIIEPPRRRNDPGITIPIHITLQPRGARTSGVPGTVDARASAVPDSAKDLYKQAMESSKSGDRNKAIEELNKALEIYPNFVSALTELGVQYMQLKQWDRATDALRKAIKISPDAFYPHLNYGIVLVQVKNYKDATSELRFAVQKDRTSAVAHLYLGRALINVGQYDAAESALRHTITIGGSGDEAVEAHRYLGAVYIEKRDSLRAADELDTYLKLAPKAKDGERIRAIIKDLRSQAFNKR